jgi:hypothetical protein
MPTKKRKPAKAPARPPIRDRRYPEYDYRLLLKAMGSDKDIQDAITAYGFEPPPIGSIRGWRVRNSIPGRWVPLLMSWAGQQGLINDAGDAINLLKAPV